MFSACAVYFSMFLVLGTSVGMEGERQNKWKAGVILEGLPWRAFISYKFLKRNFRHNKKKRLKHLSHLI